MTGRIIAGGLSLTRIYTRPLAELFSSNMAQRIQLSTANIFKTIYSAAPHHYPQQRAFSTKQSQETYVQRLPDEYFESNNASENKSGEKELSFAEFVEKKVESFEEFCQSPDIIEYCKGDEKKMKETYNGYCKTKFCAYKQMLYGGNSAFMI